jgi:CRP-like cAMP-binding protein
MCSHGSVLSKSRPFRQGEQPEDCHILLDGFVYRYTVFEDGRRQILSFHVPGDIYDTLHFLLPEADHNIATLTPGHGRISFSPGDH